MIYSPITHYFGQDSYDRIREGLPKGSEKPMTPNEPLYHFMVQTINAIADVGPKVMLISSSTPNIASYYYQGPGKVAYRATTSPAYKAGFRAAKRFGPRAARVGGRIGTKLIPGVGWALLAYDVYDLVANKRLFGIEL